MVRWQDTRAGRGGNTTPHGPRAGWRRGRQREHPKVGDKVRIVAYAMGGCRSLSPLWLHYQASGKRRQVYNGYAGANYSYGAGAFMNETFEVWM